MRYVALADWKELSQPEKVEEYLRGLGQGGLVNMEQLRAAFGIEAQHPPNSQKTKKLLQELSSDDVGIFLENNGRYSLRDPVAIQAEGFVLDRPELKKNKQWKKAFKPFVKYEAVVISMLRELARQESSEAKKQEKGTNPESKASGGRLC